jgi:hypothetical protein
VLISPSCRFSEEQNNLASASRVGSRVKSRCCRSGLISVALGAAALLLVGCSRQAGAAGTALPVPVDSAGSVASAAGGVGPVVSPAVATSAALTSSASPVAVPSPVTAMRAATPKATSPSAASPTPSVSTASGPLTIVEIGDSLGMDLGYGMRDVLAGAHGVTLVQAAKGNSGLVQPQYYDWPAHLRQLLAQHHPQVVVVFIGANDVQNFWDHGVLQHFGSPGWQGAYAQRVASMMQAASDAGTRMLWVGMPIMASATFSNSMQLLNAIYQQQAKVHPTVSYFSSWELFSNAAGGYTNTIIDAAGRTIVLRTPDGIHVTFGSGGGGADYLARAVVGALQHRFGLQLAVASAS